MSLSYIDWIERYNLNFQLHIKESESSSIYKQIDLEERIEDLKAFNDIIVDVVATEKINSLYYFKIKYKNILIGWCSPKGSSIAYVKGPKQEIKIQSKESINNKLNNILEIDTLDLKNNWYKIFISDFYAIYKNEVYCSVMLKGELLGFINIEEISFFINYRKEFKFINDNVNLYKDSKLDKKIDEDFKHGEKKYHSLGGFEKQNSIRIVVEDKRYWTNISSTNISIEKPTIKTTDDLIMDALLYQLKDKINAQNTFYNKRIEVLKEEIGTMRIEKIKMQEKFKKIKEIL